MRKALKLDMRTHRFLLEPLSNHKHLETVLVGRFVKFSETLDSHKKFGLKFLNAINKQDMRTVYGKNIENISRKYSQNVDDVPHIDLINLKTRWKYWYPSQLEVKKTESAYELMEAVRGNLHIEGFSHKEMKEMFDMMCSA